MKTRKQKPNPQQASHDPDEHLTWPKFEPKTLGEVMQVCPDQDLRAHLIALKKNLARARMIAIWVNPRPIKTPKNTQKEVIQGSLF